MTQLIDGKRISKEIKDELKEKVAELKIEGKEICLAVIQVGNDPASSVYVNNKKKACAYIGIESDAYELPEDTTEEELLELVEKLNRSPKVNGILVQLPLPGHIDEDKVIRTISPDKDVDGFHPVSVGRLWIRHVIVPGLTDNDEALDKLAEYISHYTVVQKAELLPYHTMGTYKYEAQGLDYKLKEVEPLSAERLANAKEIFKKHGITI